ncbi:MAG: redoxin domain-containing protein [Chloroflexi bacterium]|nr:redoxin domain-containing protein [Chloroflexota bacterium]
MQDSSEITLELGESAPDFTLPDLQDKAYHLADFRGRLVVLDFWSAECPISEKYDPYFAAHYAAWQDLGVTFLAIDSNAGYTVAEMQRVAAERHLPFPILRDQGNKVADQYGALTTPHIYILDRQGCVAYQGAVDDTTFRKKAPTRNYLQEALRALLAGTQPEPAQTPPYGCTIVRQFEV